MAGVINKPQKNNRELSGAKILRIVDKQNVLRIQKMAKKTKEYKIVGINPHVPALRILLPEVFFVYLHYVRLSFTIMNGLTGTLCKIKN